MQASQIFADNAQREHLCPGKNGDNRGQEWKSGNAGSLQKISANDVQQYANAKCRQSEPAQTGQL
jgi:hypothetical protein